MKVPFFSTQREHKKIQNNLIKSFQVSLKHGKTLQGPEVKKLEKQILKYVDKKYAIAVGSCTDALFFSLKALGIKKGDEIIVTSYSYLASATCILRCNAKPIFVDVNQNGNIDLKQIKKKITKNTRAVIYVHLFGYCEEIVKLKNLLEKKKIFLIEDFAQSFGSINKNVKSGSTGIISCTSFDPTKVLSTTGSGGMVFTNIKRLKDLIVKMRYHGKSINNKGDNDILGYNSQLSTLNAATLLLKLKNFDLMTKKRINIANIYIDKLKNLPIKLPPKMKNKEHIYHKFVIQTYRRDALVKFLNKNGIETMIHYNKPIDSLSVFKKYLTKNPMSNYLSKTSLSLPIHSYLKKKEVYYVINKINLFFK